MGATVGKLYGMPQAMQGGVGTASAQLDNVWVGALVVCNALGDVRDPATGMLLAGTREAPDSLALADTAEQLRQGATPRLDAGTNTTLGIVATNARLSKPQARKLAQLAQHGLVKGLSPAHTLYDGDTMFAVSTGAHDRRPHSTGHRGGRPGGRIPECRSEGSAQRRRRAGAGRRLTFCSEKRRTIHGSCGDCGRPVGRRRQGQDRRLADPAGAVGHPLSGRRQRRAHHRGRRREIRLPPDPLRGAASGRSLHHRRRGGH